MPGAGVAPPSGKHAQVSTPDRPELESKIASQFNDVFKDVNESDLLDDEPVDAPAEQSGQDEPEPGEAHAAEGEAAEEGQAPASDENETPTDEAGAEAETPAQEAAASSKAPTLPAAYRRTLKAYEWTDEEIDANLKSLGTKFIETAAKMHTNRNKEVAAWAEAGRNARKPAAGTETPKKDATEQPQSNPVMKPIDAAALKARYGDEAFIDEIVGPVNSAIERINGMLPVAQQFQQSMQQQQMELLSRQIDGFFSGKDMEAFKDTYGTASGTLTEQQAEARQKVLEYADALIGGARLQGRNLTLNEAMQMAFDSVSGETKTQAARKEITQQLQKRNKAITMKPAGKRTPSANPAKNRTDLESRVKGQLAAIFGS